jgi:hypothetical protein
MECGKRSGERFASGSVRRLTVMKKLNVAITLAIVLLALAACKVEKTGQDTYRVVAPTPQAKAAGEKAKDDAKEAMGKVRDAVHEATATNSSGTSGTTQTTSTSSNGTTTTTTTTKTKKKT